MKSRFRGSIFLILAGCALLLCSLSGCYSPTWPEIYAEQNADNLSDPIGGWNILSDYYQADTAVNNVMDALSIEWDYYSIHDDSGNFTGIVGYLVCDPQGKLDGEDPAFVGVKLMPSGANLAFNGEFKDGSRNANYLNFSDYEASATERSWYAEDSDGSWGRQTPVYTNEDGMPEMHLEGVTPDYAWDLRVTQAWSERDSLACRQPKWAVGNDLNPLKINREHWTVNMIWPTTRVKGTVTNRQTGVTYPVDGHGYRENSFGRWAFCFGGWDFYFMSDMEQEIQLGFQTYHFNTEDLDFMDVDFIDPATGEAVGIRCHAKDNELGWDHTEWQWDLLAGQALPKTAHIIGKKDGYIVDVTAAIDEHYYPMLSDITPLTKIFVINCLFPTYSGTIKRIDGEVLYTFEDIQGGGEFALPKSIVNDAAAELLSELIYNKFYRLFSHSFPE